jgi:frataxin-like iron-binding protein CyaY
MAKRAETSPNFQLSDAILKQIANAIEKVTGEHFYRITTEIDQELLKIKLPDGFKIVSETSAVRCQSKWVETKDFGSGRIKTRTLCPPEKHHFSIPLVRIERLNSKKKRGERGPAR